MRAAWRSAAVIGVSVVLAASGCRKDDKEKEKAAEAEQKTATAGGAKKGGKSAKDEGIDVPTEVDFEAAVESQITAGTDLKQELDEIEKQIGQ
jgi:hypothetical protein